MIIDTDDQTMPLGDLSPNWMFIHKDAMERYWKEQDDFEKGIDSPELAFNKKVSGKAEPREPAIFMKTVSNGKMHCAHFKNMRSGNEAHLAESRVHAINIKTFVWEL